MALLDLDASNWINFGILLVSGGAAVIAVSQARAASRSVKAAREVAAASRRQAELTERQLAVQSQELARQAEENTQPFAPRIAVRVEPIEQVEYVGASVLLHNLGKVSLEILQISLDGGRVEFDEAESDRETRQSIAIIPPNDSSMVLQSTRPRGSFRKKRAPRFSSSAVEVTVRHALDELAVYIIRFDAVSESDVYLRVGVPEMIRSPYEDW